MIANGPGSDYSDCGLRIAERYHRYHALIAPTPADEYPPLTAPTPLPTDNESRARWRPWRSAALGCVVAALALVAGVPLFLCLPPWNDVTLHDMVARTILRGGVQYRDVFDTNLPGIDWSMAAIRAAFGWGYEVLRAADLIVVGAITFVLCVWVRRCGGTGYAVAWFVAAIALFYPFTSEFSHVQRDVWMTLPAVLACRLRLKRVSGSLAKPQAAAILEGFVWGIAVWFKPHVVVPALAVWGVSAVLIARREPGRNVRADLAGLILGGVLAGAPGVLWLVGSGAWPYFLDIFLNWNPDYLSEAGSLSMRFGTVFNCFRPWSNLQFVALPLAVLALLEARVWSRKPAEPARVRSRYYLAATSEREIAARALLAACYLAWMAQVVFVQKAFDYVHVPLTFLGMALVASQRWCFGFAYLVWFVVAGALAHAADVSPTVKLAADGFNGDNLQIQIEKHALAEPRIVRLWPRCRAEGGSADLRNQLGTYTNIHCGTNWTDLEAVAGFLSAKQLGPGELNCWHDSTHPLYLMLDLDPATRYMHFGTAFGIKSKQRVIAAEVAASRQRFVVSDLLRTTWDRDSVTRESSWRAGDPLPLWLPPAERARFPWNQRVTFRSGRYIVHEVDPKALGLIRVPDWDKLDRLGEPDPAP